MLEQVVEDYLQLNGYFTRHNLKFRPSKTFPGYSAHEHSVASDVDVIGIHPRRSGPDRVRVVSCKAWQAGFFPAAKLAELREEKANPKRATWRHFRELWRPEWSEAFRDEVEKAAGQRDFHYSIAVTALKGPGSDDPTAAAAVWSADPTIAKHLDGCSFSFLTMKDMWAHLQASLTTTPAASEIGRLAQLLRAAGVQA
ncbi:hypothetical protein F1C76_02105 [Geodermatophilaceae bacterium NBWT11]|nr:hypothetical protein F1C76_02105 [Geodermatophilaceae bacterium NBWT11]